MRPAGPVPGTCRRSTPASRALRRTAGAARGFSPSGRGAPRANRRNGAVRVNRPVADPGKAVAAGARSNESPTGRFANGADTAVSAAGAFALGATCASVGAELLSSPRTFRRTRSEPTATTSPISAPSQTISPSTGEGISTVALSVMTAARIASSRTRSPILTCHSTSSASATPSPTSGSLIKCSVISLLHCFEQRAADASGTREVIPFLRIRIGRIPTRDAPDWDLQVVEACFLHQCGKLRAETRRPRRLMDDHASARLSDRCFDRLQIKRQQRAQVDDFSIDAGFGNGRHADMDHRPVGEQGQGRALAPDNGLPQRHHMMTVRNLAEFVFRPRCDGPVVMTVEGAVVEPLWL